MEKIDMFSVGDYVTVNGYKGIAWYVQGHDKVWEPETYWEIDDDDHTHKYLADTGEGELIDGDDWVCTMVGDDRDFTFEEHELTKIPEEDFCGSCGQIGCGWG